MYELTLTAHGDSKDAVDALLKAVPVHQIRVDGVPVDIEAKAAAEEDAAVEVVASVDFASDEAAELALDNGLVPADFAGRKASGVGGFTKADVQAVIDDKDDAA